MKLSFLNICPPPWEKYHNIKLNTPKKHYFYWSESLMHSFCYCFSHFMQASQSERYMICRLKIKKKSESRSFINSLNSWSLVKWTHGHYACLFVNVTTAAQGWGCVTVYQGEAAVIYDRHFCSLLSPQKVFAGTLYELYSSFIWI